MHSINLQIFHCKGKSEPQKIKQPISHPKKKISRLKMCLIFNLYIRNWILGIFHQIKVPFGVFIFISICFFSYLYRQSILINSFKYPSILLTKAVNQSAFSPLLDAIRCVNRSNSLERFAAKSYSERLQHSLWINREIKRLTPKYDKYMNSSYSGLYIEIIWAKLQQEPFSIFGPFVPLFVPWVYVFVDNLGIKMHRYFRWRNKILKLLSEDYFYITLSQNDDGIEGRDEKSTFLPSNLLVISPGGKGHIPLLLFTKEYHPMNYSISNFQYDLVFAGTMTHEIREIMVKEYSRLLGNRFKYYASRINWLEEYPKSKFICAPRGNGRNSYRLAEVLQTGQIPVYIYNDIIWLPYYDSINWSEFAIISHYKHLNETINRIKNTTPDQIQKMRKRIADLYYTHFTIPATMNHIKLFLQSGFSKCDLRCAKYGSTIAKQRYIRFLWLKFKIKSVQN